jgi:hypothetical protein
MVRLKYLGDFATSTDQTWDNTIGIMVSIIEICVAMICKHTHPSAFSRMTGRCPSMVSALANTRQLGACLPALRALFCNLFPSIFGRETTYAAEYGDKYPNNDAKPAFPSNLLSTSNSKSVLSVTTRSASRDRMHFRQSSQESILPVAEARSTNQEEQGIGSNAWFGNQKGGIRHDQEFVQDVEQDAIPTPPLRHDGVHRPQTVTTKIWVDNGGTRPMSPASRPSPLQRLRSRTMERKGSATGEDGFARSKSRQGSVGSSEGGLEGATSRSGSEDSIFALQGPRREEYFTGNPRNAASGNEDIEMHPYNGVRGRS